MPKDHCCTPVISSNKKKLNKKLVFIPCTLLSFIFLLNLLENQLAAAFKPIWKDKLSTLLNPKE